MAEVSQAVCDLCGEGLDGGRVLCVACSRRALHARKAALRQSYLAVAAADERAGQELAELRGCSAFAAACARADTQARFDESRARIAALRAHLALLQERNASSLLLSFSSSPPGSRDTAWSDTTRADDGWGDGCDEQQHNR